MADNKEYIQQRPRVDTRGLPEGYDPHYFYEYSSHERSKTADGVEGFLYRWMPLTLVKSFAFAIDPFSQFKVSSGVVTPVNRTRLRSRVSVLNTRYARTYAYTQSHNFKSVLNHNFPPTYNAPVVNSDSTTLLLKQDVVPDRSKDTTVKTRLVSSGTGELELFKFQIFSPERRQIYVSSSDDRYISSTDGSVGQSGSVYRYERTYYPSAASITKTNINNLRDSELTRAYAEMPKLAISMFKDILPLRRNYSLFRNIVELRDIPRSIESYRKICGDLAKLDASLSKGLRAVIFNTKTVLKDIPNEYLSFHFGWRQSLSDLAGLVNSPTKVAKQIEFLMARNGKATTYRSKRNFSNATPDVPGFSYETGFYDDGVVLKSRIDRSYEARMVVSNTYQFPPPDIPQLRKYYFWDKLGVNPRPTDIYNLIPWTWLVDWFTGLGNYVELIDEVNSDDGLINWGFLTLHCKGSLTTEFKSTTTSHYGMRVFSSGPTQDFSRDEKVTNSHTSVLDYSLQLRKSLANVMDVNTTSDVNTLSSYQKSILGALLSQRSKYWRGH